MCTVRDEQDLRDERVAGYHHGDGPEETLEVVGQLLAARVGRVAGDEHSEAQVQVDILLLERDFLLLEL